MRSCLIVAVALCYAQSASALATSVSDDPPSIVIIFTDDQGYGGVSVFITGVLPVTSNARAGSEHPAQTSGQTPISETGGAEYGAQRAPRGQFDHDLQQLIDVWPDLPPAVRAGIVAMVRAATENTP